MSAQRLHPSVSLIVKVMPTVFLLCFLLHFLHCLLDLCSLPLFDINIVVAIWTFSSDLNPSLVPAAQKFIDTMLLQNPIEGNL